MTKTLNQLKALVLSGAIVLTTQAVNLMRGGNTLDVMNAIIGMVCIIAICIVSLKIKEALPLKIPAFAWASLLGTLLTTPWCPIQEQLLGFTAQISSGQVGTVILAVAGISIGTKLDDIKRLSWKMVVVACAVFCGTFFGSAIIAQVVLKLQGLI